MTSSGGPKKSTRNELCLCIAQRTRETNRNKGRRRALAREQNTKLIPNYRTPPPLPLQRRFRSHPSSPGQPYFVPLQIPRSVIVRFLVRFAISFPLVLKLAQHRCARHQPELDSEIGNDSKRAKFSLFDDEQSFLLDSSPMNCSWESLRRGREEFDSKFSRRLRGISSPEHDRVGVLFVDMERDGFPHLAVRDPQT